MDLARLSVTDKLLLAALALDAGEGSTFTAEQLTIAAWKRFPRVFGLRGETDEQGLPIHPDSNRVFAEIMGAKPIRKRGYLVKVGPKLYALTASGRALARQLADGSDASGRTAPRVFQGKTALPRDMMAKIQRLLISRAAVKHRTDEIGRITFHDACVFWGVTPASSFIDLEGNLASAAAAIAKAEEAVSQGVNDLDPAAVLDLRRVHEHMQLAFASELATIRRRTDERRAER